MPNPGAFSGARLAFLKDQKQKYANSLVSNTKAECLLDIQRRYFKRFPITMPDDQEPDSEALASVDDSEPDVEFAAPEEHQMSPEDYIVALKEFAKRQKDITFKKGQIDRWFDYTFKKSRGPDPKKVSPRTFDPNDPLTILKARLVGADLAKPRAGITYNIFARENKKLVDDEYNRQVKEQRQKMMLTSKKRGGKVDVNLRRNISRAFYDNLQQEEKGQILRTIEEEHQVEMEAWNELLNRPAATDPASRQACIDRITPFSQPILDLICEHTGMAAFLCFGGPEPDDGGRLNVINICSGTTVGVAKQNFVQSEREHYKNDIIPVFTRFLKKVYTKEECRARAMPGTTLKQSIDNTVEGDANPERPRRMGYDGGDGNGSSSKPKGGEFLLDGGSTTRQNPQRPATTPPAPLHPPPLWSPSPPLSSPSRTPSPPSSPPFGVPSLPPSPLRPTHPPLLPLENGIPKPSPMEAVSRPKAPALPSFSAALPLTPQSVKAVSADPFAEGMAQKSKRKPHENEGDEGPAKRQKSGATISSRPLRSIAETVHALTNSPGSQRTSQPSPVKATSTLSSSSSTHRPQPTHPLNNISKSKSTSTSERRSHVISLPRDAPPWIRNALAMLESEDLGDQWMPLVDAWFKYEERHAFGKGPQLSAQGRPRPIGRWIQLARKRLTNEQARDAGMDGFEEAFWSWWVGLQPTWRKIAANATSREVDGNWEEIDKHGVNGLLSVVAALHIWRLHGSDHTSWPCAVDDVCWVLTQLA